MKKKEEKEKQQPRARIALSDRCRVTAIATFVGTINLDLDSAGCATRIELECDPITEQMFLALHLNSRAKVVKNDC